VTSTNRETEYLRAVERYKHEKRLKFLGPIDCLRVVESLGWLDQPIPELSATIEDAKPSAITPAKKEASLFD
jgi:hypothetical protein